MSWHLEQRPSSSAFPRGQLISTVSLDSDQCAKTTHKSCSVMSAGLSDQVQDNLTQFPLRSARNFYPIALCLSRSWVICTACTEVRQGIRSVFVTPTWSDTNCTLSSILSLHRTAPKTFWDQQKWNTSTRVTLSGCGDRTICQSVHFRIFTIFWISKNVDSLFSWEQPTTIPESGNKRMCYSVCVSTTSFAQGSVKSKDILLVHRSKKKQKKYKKAFHPLWRYESNSLCSQSSNLPRLHFLWWLLVL